ncbi:LacI family DNA-binding transcriptional regulator [Phytoactinopolyspora halotolerans]|uniref:LacI family transcriptional regulator n=1 Tax=Phytoactinopolyspora halotolerans TaxID=1981512 RepID=A0A6L9S453_9ACTN|nr:LacI family DNA-binding transcriptional regulator [Phytoactinopolyspora halotolerans]NED99423.1 LacI family transcriptional regulator [Phytoactinopolyspora halotolerans]
MRPTTRGTRTTIADVAALAGVSTAAVSKVINQRPGVSAEMRRRVLAAADKLGWVPSSAAAALRGAATRTLGLVLRRAPDLLSVDPHFSVFIAGAEDVLGPRGYGLQLHLVGERTGAEEATYRGLAARRAVDGVILTESRLGDPRFELVRQLGLPAVLVGTPWNDDPLPRVEAGPQDRGMRDMTRRLIQLGHRRIAYVGGPEDLVHTVFRREVVTSELSAAGLAPVRLVSTPFAGVEAIRVTEELLALPDRPTAIVFGNDVMAVAGLGAVQRHGVSVPDEVSIVGHDDLPLGELLHPRLSTVRLEVRQLGRAAAIELLRTLGVQDLDEVHVDPPSFIERESTGPPPDDTGAR